MSKYVSRGKLVSLRVAQKEDVPLLVKWRNNPRVRNNHIYREDFTVDGQLAWMEREVGSGRAIQFIICENSFDGETRAEGAEEDFRPIGCVHYQSIDREEGTAEYGIYIGEDDATGKGYGSEAAELALEYARDVLGLKHVILRVFAFNKAAIGSYVHAGFEKIQDLPQVECSDGQKDDMILMEKNLT